MGVDRNTPVYFNNVTAKNNSGRMLFIANDSQEDLKNFHTLNNYCKLDVNLQEKSTTSCLSQCLLHYGSMKHIPWETQSILLS